jgi:four helix bundle protein
MSGSDFRRVVAYRLSAALADDLHALVGPWPSFDRWSTGLQLVRAADSVGANIAEGLGRWHGPDRRRFLIIARGSLYEVEHWLLRAQARGLTNDIFEGRLAEIARTLHGLIQATRA